MPDASLKTRMSEPNNDALSRRTVLQLSASAMALPQVVSAQVPAAAAPASVPISNLLSTLRDNAGDPVAVDLAPARWIWLPSARTLPNTFVLFRKELFLTELPTQALAFLTADSRYKLTVNGQRVQWGPAPCDPRSLDVDVADLRPYLQAGRNVIGVEVLFYGHGEGTWAAGKPGFLFHMPLPQGPVISDESWWCKLDRAHQPGQYKRWYLRSLQEIFDAQQRPEDWDKPLFKMDSSWMKPALIPCPSDKPAACRTDAHWSADSVDRIPPERASLRLRSIPPSQEEMVPARFLGTFTVEWKRPPEDWFDLRIADSFQISVPGAVRTGNGFVEIEEHWPSLGIALTYDFPEQLVGFPYFEINAPAGTIIDVMVQEAHEPGRGKLMDNHFFAWSRFVCREGVNRFECFDYESLRFVQLHIRNFKRSIRVSNVGVRRKSYAWPKKPQVTIADPALQRLMDASFNTIRNSAVETIVDGMGRERQQYSGDCGHELHAIRYAYGEQRICKRYLRTYSEGLTPGGYFMDAWPAYDRLARVAQKQMDGAYWGPLLDHGVGFVFDNYNHYWETGDKSALVEPYPRLARFIEYLQSIRGKDGLLPVSNLGIPTVWIDHSAYQKEAHKQCAFNLYTIAMLRHAFVPLAELFGESTRVADAKRFADELLAATQRRFWSSKDQAYCDNLPWLDAEKEARFSDRALATAVLYGLNPKNNDAASVRMLAEVPPQMGLSYPANAGWRLWALGKAGRADIIAKDLRERWAPMPSVKLNNTLAEFWTPKPDSTNEWSHCPVVPVYILYMELLGLRPLEAGFGKARLRPQLADLPDLDVVAQLPQGPLRFVAKKGTSGYEVSVETPVDIELEVAPGTSIQLQDKRLSPGSRSNLAGSRKFSFLLSRV